MVKMPEFPPIKFDLQTRHGTIYGEEEKQAILECLANDAPTSGKKVDEFENKYAEMCDTKYAITVSNGTAALTIAYNAIGIQPGDEVITTPITWIATPAAAVVMGAKIKFCDIDPTTFNMDPTKLKALITPKTKIICPVHLYGQPVDMDPILEIARQNHIAVVEDAAHAPGAVYKGKKAGNLGDIGCFSFHEQKNMSTLGEGGMVTFNDPKLYDRIRGYKSHCARVIGKSTKYLSFSEDLAEKYLASNQFWFQDFDDCGYNFRMADMPAAVGICQLKRLESMNNRRREIAKELDVGLAKLDGIVPLRSIPNIVHTYHLYPVLLDSKQLKVNRDDFIFKLRKEFGIKCGINYLPLVQTQAFKKRNYSENDSPVAVKMWKNLVILPIHPRMTVEHIQYLLDSIKKILQ